ncbi:GDSL esterase/lipase, partial [Mucuna pruriens]
MHISPCGCHSSPYFLHYNNTTSSIEMAAKTKPWFLLSVLLLAVNCMQHCVHGESQVPCLFIFGDSLSDNGNNNNLLTTAKSNYVPYGIDFPKGPTGRFTDGKTSIDFISEYLGFAESSIPPYANTGGSDILKGVNYASGAAGIRPETGKLGELNFNAHGANIHLGAQMKNHKDIYSKIADKLGDSEKAKQYLNKCLYYLNIGNNDYINNYFHPIYPTSRFYTPEQYAKVFYNFQFVFRLISQIDVGLCLYRIGKYELHDEFGARKFVLVPAGVIGCTPNAMNTHKTNGSCVEEMNNAKSMFNDKLRSLVDQFNNKFSADSKFIFAGSTDSSIYNGFSVVNASCCRTVAHTGCVPLLPPCQNRTEYAFWDGFHFTEAVNQITAIRSYNGSDPAFTYPMNIMQLVQSS